MIGTAWNRSDDPLGPPLVVDQVAAAVTDSEVGTLLHNLELIFNIPIKVTEPILRI